MANPLYKRVRVNDGQFCIDRQCRSCLAHWLNMGQGAEVECSRRDCDNHLGEAEDELPPTPLHSLPRLPPVGSIFE